ncbi:MAG: DUF3179 domain-containing (seleno)protein [Gammaproteobacteria bacterium]
MNPWLPLVFGLFLLLGPTAIVSYLVSPLPGSQSLDSVTAVYYLVRAVPFVLPLGMVLTGYGLFAVLRSRKSIVGIVGVVAIGVLAIAGLYRQYLGYAPVMFKEFENVSFAQGTSNALPGSTIVMGSAGPETAKAYPIRVLGYHHRLMDELDGVPIWVTYCPMCRTGKVFSPMVNGEKMDFKLVGAIQLNSIYRDVSTGSIWYQANGRAAAGPMTGERLSELRVDQMTLEQWLNLFPNSLVLQPDPTATSDYLRFRFDNWDQRRSDDSRLPQFRWVVGVVHGNQACAYRWAQLRAAGLLQDSVDGLPIAVRLAADGISYRVWDRRLQGETLELSPGADGTMLHAPSNSLFGMDGVGQSGLFAGEQLQPVAATVEFAHSFQNFSGGEYCPRP